MIIWGKIIGAALGFTFYGPAGFILGLVFGHIFDKGLSNVYNVKGHTAQVRMVFFSTVFQTMGCIAKADGVVSDNEIRVARDIMLNDFKLNKTQMLAAIQFFNEGKKPDFDLGAVLNRFRAMCVKQPDLRRYFLELIVKSASADNVLWPAVYVKLQFICARLNVPLNELEYQLRSYKFTTYTSRQGSTKQKSGSEHRQAWGKTKVHSSPLDEAYHLLGVQPSDDDAKIKTAYRRLMNKYHPDKLVAKGLPEEMLSVAQEKAQQISAAYDLIMRSRKL